MNISASVFLLSFCMSCALCWGGKDKVKLKDVSTLTLQQGMMTTGRRSRPVPQMQCVGGSAGCSVPQPSSVQCYNRGSDGYDVQWECKAEMDSRYKFGRTEVICEGYDYPDDPYILKGSCGLEYTLDHKSSGGGSNSYWSSSSGYYPTSTKKPSTFGDLMGGLITLAIIAIIVYALYKTCISNEQYSTTQDDYPDDSRRSNSGGFFGGRHTGAPPPYPETNYFPGEGCSQQQSYGYGGRTSGTTRFWQGVGTGGVLGYLFGSRNQGYGSSQPYYRNYDHSGQSYNNSSPSTSTSTSYASTRRR